MLRFLTSRRLATRPASSIPSGACVYAIGDVHGCLDQLERLLLAVASDAAGRAGGEPTLIFTGDLVDRGPASAGVVELLRRLKLERPATRFLMGNHEEVFLAALTGDRHALRCFSRIGGRETAISYGLSAQAYERMDFEELGEALAAAVPENHRAFLTRFEDMVVTGDYAFVHAGIHPDRPLDAQRVHDLRWIRSPFLEHRGVLEKVVVHGHTVTENVDWCPHRIGIDTGAYRTGRLTALGLQEDRRWLVQV